MKNHNDQAMASYFSAMLSEKPSIDSATKTLVDEPLEHVQETIPLLPETLVFSAVENADKAVASAQSCATPEAAKQEDDEWKQLTVENEFQVLFFELAGVTFAIPLAELGGIHELVLPLNSLLGKPDWFTGVVTHNQSLFNIVDTAKWINIGSPSQTLNYTHFVLLGSTEWGLSCEKLLGTETLKTEQIKWRKVPGKRPWLAGMVKDKMCALLHAEELVKLLQSGINIIGT